MDVVSAAFVETIKSAEPFSTVLLGYFFLQEHSSAATYLSLIIICAGVALSCYHNDDFDSLGMLFSLISNACFSARAVYTKIINLDFPDSADEIELFCAISVRGFFILIPITLIVEGKDCLQLLSSYREDNADRQYIGVIVPLLVINGIMFACYNLMSYIVLKRTDLVTHSVMNVFRRVFVIGATTIYFRLNLGSLCLLGITAAIIGVLLYGFSRTADHRKQSL